MTGSFAIRQIRAAPGEVARGFLPIGETAAGPIQVPVTILHGREPGPILCLTAGVHATEYPPIDAVLRTIQSVRPAALRGTVIAAPVVNLRMFESRMPFVSPLDGVNLNKAAPGSPAGTISQILAHVLLEEIIGRAGYHIDLHGGDFGEMLMPFCGYALTGDTARDRDGETLARVYGPKLISLAGPDGKIPPFADGIVHAACHRGVISLFAEAGGNGTLEEADVLVHVAGIRNVMCHLGMIDGTPAPVGPRVKARDRTIVRATKGGLLRLRVAIGDEVRAGQEVGEIVDLFGEVVERVVSTGSGFAGLVWAHKVVHTGDPIFRYWITEPG
jgi:predicted deacylase